MRRSTAIIIALVILLGVAGVFVLSSDRYQQWLAERQKQNLPVEENINFAVENDNSNANVANSNANTNTSTLPSKKNFAVPFTSQAPDVNWDQDHEEFCEEASVLMVGRFWKQLPISNTADAEAALQRIKVWELDNLGFYYDTTAAETAKILEGLYSLKTSLIQNPSIDEIKAELAAGHPVIVPEAGRNLGSPYYTPPGPIYHMLVIKGYTADGKFITNDAGTRHGADYVFDQNVVMDAMHDWVPGNDRTIPGNGTPTGNPVAIVAELN